MGRKKPGASALILGIVAFAFLDNLAVHAVTIATFADPTIGASPVVPMFYVNNGTITGGWTGTGLDVTLENLPIPSVPPEVTYNNVIMEFNPLTYSGTYSSGTVSAGQNPGEFRFYARDTLGNKAQEILRIDFNSADVSKASLGSDNIFADNGVTFTVMGTTLNLDDESFAFAFTNQKKLMTGTTVTGFSATAAFTSSGTPITPEPASMMIIAGLGLPLVLRRRR